MTSPENESKPGMVGQATSFSEPRAAMRTSASSSMVSPVFVFSIFRYLEEDQEFVGGRLKHDLPLLSTLVPRATFNGML